MVSEILSWLASLITSVISGTGYVGVTVLMALESAGVPVPSEVIMPFSGYLVTTGRFSFWLATFWATVGNLFGSLILYLVGYYGGRRIVIKYGRYFLISQEELNKSDQWFKKYGSLTIFFSRMTPIVRTYISLPAGIAKMNLVKFLSYTFFGSVPWNLVLAYSGVILGSHWKDLEIYFRKFDYLILILIILIIGWWVKKHIIKKNINNQ